MSMTENRLQLQMKISEFINMDPKEKEISYTSTNTYLCLNTLNKDTKNVWFVLHGLGFLSKFFINYFRDLPQHENYIIAPQAPSKYYLNSKYTRVGASWLTKENRELETENNIEYLDGIYRAENIPPNCRLIVLGFSQGVSIAARWVAKSKIPCKELVLYAGGIPEELTAEDFDFLIPLNTKIKIVLGTQDEFLTRERLKKERIKIAALFNDRAEYITFDGRHEVDVQVINDLLK